MNTTTRRINTSILEDPFFIGFDSLLNKVQHQAKSYQGTNYPPYNLIKTGEDSYLIELAVAGFDEEDFDIQLQDGVLTIKGEVGTSEFEADYIHKGIAARNFERKFTLADTIEVEGASLHQGVLTVRLRNIIPEEKKPRKILIGQQPEQQLLTEDE